MATCPSCAHENRDGAKYCEACATPLGVRGERAERKVVTALFCDLVGSTALGERYDPEVLRRALRAYFDEARAAVERHGGRVEKYIGDAIAAVFGMPTVHEDDALRAVRAGIEIQERVRALAPDAPVPIECRIGVNTGEVLASGDDTPLVGDAMNTASRLQSGAAPGEVWIGEPTWRLVRDAVVAEEVEALHAKGKAEPVAAYRVLQVASLSPMRTRRLDAPMIGRERESDLLDRAYERAVTDRACQLFTVLGSAGAGKSRLVEEFLSRHEGAEVLQGRCLSYGEGITFYPVTEALKQALALADFDPEATIRGAITTAVAGEDHEEALVANLAKLFAAGGGGAPEETNWAIRRFFETRAREGALVVVFDDIHWGEETFLDLVTHIAEWSRDAAILVVCMARPDLLDVRPTWSGGLTNATTISLAPLSEHESAKLIDHLLGSAALPGEIRTRITTVAEGNPLFVEEMLRMLVDDDLLTRDGERWVASGDLTDVQVPATISALLSARLDRLSGSERAVLERAAVVGKVFHRGAVAELLPASDREGLDHQLRSLVRKELVTPERSTLPGHDAYRFRHLLIRDAAYDAVPKAERAELHVAFADWLEAAAGERVAEQLEIVGAHLERAHRYRVELGLPEDRELKLRAARALGDAGVRASKRGDVTATIDLLTPAVELAAGDPIELPYLARLGDASFSSGDLAGWEQVSERLLDVAMSAGDPVYEIAAKERLATSRSLRDPRSIDNEADRSLHERAVEVYQTHGAHDLLPDALLSLGICDWFDGRMAGLRDYATQALELATAGDDLRAQEGAISYLLISLRGGDPPLSESLDLADRLAEEFADRPAALAVVLLHRAYDHALQGRLEESVAEADACRAVFEELGDRWFGDQLADVLALQALVRDETAAAASIYRALLDDLLEQGDLLNRGQLGMQLARVLLELGRTEEADRVVAHFRGVPDAEQSIAARSIDAVIAARRGDVVPALRLSDEAQALAAPTDLAIEKGDVALDRAEVLLHAGRPDDARASAEDALARFERKEYAIGSRRARAFLERLET
jgi:class 3 adenylate cyclase/tetratricopeptide (TPR) repeat protein